MKNLVFLFIFISTFLNAGIFPNKCTHNSIIKREILTNNSSSSPVPKGSKYYEECSFKVDFKSNSYRTSYKNCWSGGNCSWVDSRWANLNQSSHGAFQVKCGYGAFYGTLDDGSGLYICWYEDKESDFIKRDPFNKSVRKSRNIDLIDHLRVTSRKYDETYTPQDGCEKEFGRKARLADWKDIFKIYRKKGSLKDFFNRLDIREGKGSYFVSRNGKEFYSSSRHYYITRHNHNKPSNYLAHENINGYELSLGSWKGRRRALCVVE